MAERDVVALTIPFRAESREVAQDPRPRPVYALLSTCPQGSLVTSVQEMQTVCTVVSGICFLSFVNFPDLREDRLEPSSRRDFGGCRSYDGEADGAPKSRSQLILLL